MCVCREFFYIQMEKYARQALAEGVKSVGDLVVTKDDELYRVLILHYNRNNQIEVTDNVWCCICISKLSTLIVFTALLRGCSSGTVTVR